MTVIAIITSLLVLRNPVITSFFVSCFSAGTGTVGPKREAPEIEEMPFGWLSFFLGHPRRISDFSHTRICPTSIHVEPGHARRAPSSCFFIAAGSLTLRSCGRWAMTGESAGAVRPHATGRSGMLCRVRSFFARTPSRAEEPSDLSDLSDASTLTASTTSSDTAELADRQPAAEWATVREHGTDRDETSERLQDRDIARITKEIAALEEALRPLTAEEKRKRLAKYTLLENCAKVPLENVERGVCKALAWSDADVSKQDQQIQQLQKELQGLRGQIR